MLAIRAALLLGLTTTVASADVTVTIDTTKPHQTMQGFGATTLSLVNGSDGIALGIVVVGLLRRRWS